MNLSSFLYSIYSSIHSSIHRQPFHINQTKAPNPPTNPPTLCSIHTHAHRRIVIKIKLPLQHNINGVVCITLAPIQLHTICELTTAFMRAFSSPFPFTLFFRVFHFILYLLVMIINE